MSSGPPARLTRRVDIVHRLGSVLFALGLWVFGILGLVNQLEFFSTTGQRILGLSSNGLLSTISLVVGAILIAAGIRGGRQASTTTAVIGVLFLLSGLVNLAVLHTELNLLAFELPNVFFSIISGMLLLFLGSYGRFSAGLPADNPYYQQRHRHDPAPARSVTDSASSTEDAAIDEEMADAERAVAQGTASAELADRVRSADRHRSQEERRRAWSAYRPADRSR